MNRVLSVIAAVLVVALSLAWIARSGGATDEAVAVVDGRPITEARYSSAYSAYLGETGLPDVPRRRLDFAERLVGMQLVIADARRNGFDRSVSFVERRDAIATKLRIDFYVQRTALDSIVVREAELREMFLRMNTSIKARHLYAGTREEAIALKDRLDAGETFEELAREVFDDPELAGSGGSLGYFGFDEMDPGFEDVAYSIPVGVISEPVRTSSGYSILQVQDRTPKPLITESEFASRRDKVRQYVRYRRHVEAKQALVRSLVARLDVEFDTDGLALLTGFVEGTTALGEEVPAPAILEQPLVSFVIGGERSTWTVGDFRAKAYETSPAQREAVKNEVSLTQFVEGLLAREAMLNGFEEAGWASDPDFRRVLDEQVDQALYEVAYDRHVSDLPVHEDSVRTYFARHSSEFQREGRIRVEEIIVDTRAEARLALNALRSEDFGDVAVRLSVRPGAEATRGDLGFLTRRQLGVLADTLFAAAPGSIVGPLEAGGRFGLFRVVGKEEPVSATFEDARETIEEMIRQRDKRGYMRQIVDSLRKRHSVSVDADRIRTLELS